MAFIYFLKECLRSLLIQKYLDKILFGFDFHKTEIESSKTEVIKVFF